MSQITLIFENRTITQVLQNCLPRKVDETVVFFSRKRRTSSHIEAGYRSTMTNPGYTFPLSIFFKKELNLTGGREALGVERV